MRDRSGERSFPHHQLESNISSTRRMLTQNLATGLEDVSGTVQSKQRLLPLLYGIQQTLPALGTD